MARPHRRAASFRSSMMNDNNLFDDVYQQLERDAAEFFT